MKYFETFNLESRPPFSNRPVDLVFCNPEVLVQYIGDVEDASEREIESS